MNYAYNLKIWFIRYEIVPAKSCEWRKCWSDGSVTSLLFPYSRVSLRTHSYLCIFTYFYILSCWNKGGVHCAVVWALLVKTFLSPRVFPTIMTHWYNPLENLLFSIFLFDFLSNCFFYYTLFFHTFKQYWIVFRYAISNSGSHIFLFLLFLCKATCKEILRPVTLIWWLQHCEKAVLVSSLLQECIVISYSALSKSVSTYLIVFLAY